MQPSPEQAPLQQQAQQQAPTQKPHKQPKQKPSMQTTKQPRYADMVAATCGAMTAAAVKAILPAPKLPQPQWQQQTHQRKAERSQQNQQNQRQNQQRAAIGVDRFAHRCHLTVSGPSLDTSGTASQVVQRVVDRVEGGAGVVVVDAVRLGPAGTPRFQFRVATVEQAETLIRGRGKALSGSGIVLSEVLSAAESALHKRLYPDFLRLKEAGHRVQFRRARLFVDGQLWPEPAGPAAA
jgi:hypothetical protein